MSSSLEICTRGIRPAATLYHWELPQPLADRGGWRNADMPHWFADFTRTVMERIGDRVTNIAEDIVFLASGEVEDLNL